MSNTAVSQASETIRPKKKIVWSREILAFLQAELSSYPGRPLLVLRIVLACTMVMGFIVVFRIPGGVLGAYFPLLISRDNLHATKRSAAWITSICTVGVIEVVVGAMLFTGSPFLHLLWVWTSLFAVFYLISSLKVYEAALALGLFVTSTITIWDQPVPADIRLQQTLFTFLAILVGCVVSVLIEYLFSRTHAPDAVLEGIRERMNLASRALLVYAGKEPDEKKLHHALRRYAARGTATLRVFVSQAGYSFEERQRLSTAVSLSGRLIDLAANLIETNRDSTETDREICIAIQGHLVRLAENISRHESLEWIDVHSDTVTNTSLLSEIERTVDLLARSLSESMWEHEGASGEHRLPDAGSKIFVADGFRKKRHVKFAISGALSAIACYMFYMSVGWTGLSASVATCMLTALPITGAARHKQLMRFAGVVLGACALGFTAQIIVLPQIDTIFSYTLLFAFVTALGAWIGTSSPRIAYCGVQIILAYELVNLNRFSLNPSLVPGRDTVLGIVLGIGAMWFIFDHLWATSSAESLRALLITTIRSINNLDIMDESQMKVSIDSLLQQRTVQIMSNFERIRSLADVSIFEAFPKDIADDLFLKWIKSNIPQLRAVLLIKTGLLHHRVASGSPCRINLSDHILQFCSARLEQLMVGLETTESTIQPKVQLINTNIQSQLLSEMEQVHSGELDCDLIELRLCMSLFDVVQHLTADLSGLPGYL